MTEREQRLLVEWDDCEGHEWEESPMVIDTAPEIYTSICTKCGAATHDGGETYCFIKH